MFFDLFEALIVCEEAKNVDFMHNYIVRKWTDATLQNECITV